MVNAWVFTAGNMDKCLIIIRSQKGKNLFWCHTGMFSFGDFMDQSQKQQQQQKTFLALPPLHPCFFTPVSLRQFFSLHTHFLPILVTLSIFSMYLVVCFPMLTTARTSLLNVIASACITCCLLRISQNKNKAEFKMVLGTLSPFTHVCLDF